MSQNAPAPSLPPGAEAPVPAAERVAGNGEHGVGFLPLPHFGAEPTHAGLQVRPQRWEEVL